MHLLEYFWYRRRPIHLLLVPLSWLFGVVSAARRLAFARGWRKSVRVSVPVIVVGNISVGGTGKTPVVLWLVELLKASGYRPGIVTRGYGGSEQVQEVRDTSTAAQAGDEALLLARRAGVPIYAGALRPAAAQALLAAHPECNVIVSDDGLQHYALARDIELAVVDAKRQFGNGWLLPAGPLREPVSRLERVHAVIVNGDGDLPNVRSPRYRMSLAGSVFRNLGDGREASAESFHAGPLHAIAGIGHPERFFSHLERLSLQFRRHPFPDHYAFAPEDLAFANDECVLMTEKDAVKCAAFAKASWWYLPVTAAIDPALGPMLLAKLKMFPT